MLHRYNKMLFSIEVCSQIGVEFSIVEWMPPPYQMQVIEFELNEKYFSEFDN